MTGPAFDNILRALEAHGHRVKMVGPGRARTWCTHDGADNPDGLSIMDAADRVNLTCFTRGCDPADVLESIGLTIRDRYHDHKGATYHYDDGRQVHRSPDKRFRQSGNTQGRPTLYRVGKVRQAVAAGAPVYLVEGESDVLALEAVGAVATSAPQGGGNFRRVDVSPLTGADVVAVVDRDEVGDRWAAQVADKLEGVAGSVRFVRAKVGKDAADAVCAAETDAEALEAFTPYRWPDEASEPVSADSGAADEEPDPADVFAWHVNREADRLRVREAARALVASENMPARDPFDFGTVADVLARPGDPADRVEGLAPWEGSTLVTAQRKTGKTTLTLNLARSLLTGAAFLEERAVRPVAGAVALLNFEVSGPMLARWAADADVPPDRLLLVNLRGRRNPFTDPADLADLARLLKAYQVETLIVDPFGRAYSGQSQNDAGEVQRWLVQLDEFARAQVGALDLFLTAHAGWNGERTRGSSALEDWADALWTLTRDQNDDDGARYLRAEGRDVDMPETRLRFDKMARRLSLGGGSRAENRQDKHLEDLAAHVVTYVTGHPGESTSAIERALREGGVSFQRGDVSKAARRAAGEGRILSEAGSRGAVCYFPTDLPRPTPTYPSGVGLTYPDPPYRGGVGQGVCEDSTYPGPDEDTRGAA